MAISCHYLVGQRRRPFFKSSDHQVKKTAVWIRIPELPVELYNNKFLWRVGSKLGTMLKIDDITSLHSRGKFARICVEIDLQRELVPTFTALGRDFGLEYEGLHLIILPVGNMAIRRKHVLML